MKMFLLRGGEIKQAAYDVNGNVVRKEARRKVGKEWKLLLPEIYDYSAAKEEWKQYSYVAIIF
jgi:hypothetical protein